MQAKRLDRKCNKTLNVLTLCQDENWRVAQDQTAKLDREARVP